MKKRSTNFLYQLQNDQDILGRRWAMAELVNLAKNEKTSTSDKTKIYAALRNVILGNSYWRLRNAAISQLQALLAPASLTTPAALDEATISMLLTSSRMKRPGTVSRRLTFLG